MVKNEVTKEEHAFKALIIADNFDRRFRPILSESTSWGCLRVANVELLHYTLDWLSRTEIRDVILAVVVEREASLSQIFNFWSGCFHSLLLVSCQNCMSVGDVIREVEGRSLITSDFLLVTNPASFCSFDLQPQIKAFSERRKDKNNVMTLLYAEREGINPVVCLEKKTNKLVFYHRGDDPSRCDIDKSIFFGESVIRSDIQDTGIALCSPVICSQFSDNFDFQQRDDVIREILVNEEILCQNIHIDVIPSDVAAFTFYDYEGFIQANRFILQRWLYPLIPGHVGDAKFLAERNNVFLALSAAESDYYNLTKSSFALQGVGPNVALGPNCKVASKAVVKCCAVGENCFIEDYADVRDSIIGNNAKIGRNVRISKAYIGNDVTIKDGCVIESKSIITDKVVLEEKTVVSGKVLCAVECYDEEEDMICTPVAYADREKAIGEGTAGKELNNVEKFSDEVKESMERIALEEFVNNQLIKNLILEINSSKLAYNISMEDVARNVFISFLSLPQNQIFAGLKAMANKWILLFQNYYKPVKSQIQLLVAIEEHFGKNVNFKPMTPNTVHLFYELDILEEEAILGWYETVANSSPIKGLVAPIIEWLNTAEEDEESD